MFRFVFTSIFVVWLLALPIDSRAQEPTPAIVELPALDTADAREIVLGKSFANWSVIPDDVRQVGFVRADDGRPIKSVFVEGNRAARWVRWLTLPGEVPPKQSLKLKVVVQDAPITADPAWTLGGHAATLPVGERKAGDTLWSFTLRTSGDGCSRVTPAARMFPGGPTAVQMIPEFNDPDQPLVSCKQFAESEIGGFGLRDFHIMTQPGGRAVQHDGHFYALVMGMRWRNQELNQYGRPVTDRAIMWTRSKSIDGPWGKPQILLTAQGEFGMVDQGSLIKLADGTFVLMYRAQINGEQQFFVMNGKSPTDFKLPEKPPEPCFNARSLECAEWPFDYAGLPHTIKLSQQSRVGNIPGTEGAYVSFIEVRKMHQGKSKWHVYACYSTHPTGLGRWSAVNAGRPVVSVSDRPESAWFAGLANAKIMEAGPNQFVLGLNAYGANVPDFLGKQDWRLWLGFSNDLSHFPQSSFRCVVNHYPGDGNHGGRLEGPHWVVGPDEPIDGPLRIIYFGSPYSSEPETNYSHIYAAYSPRAADAQELQLGTRKLGDSAYMHKVIPAGTTTIELALDGPGSTTERGVAWVPAVLDRETGADANGWALLRRDDGRFRFCEIAGGKPMRVWHSENRSLLDLPDVTTRTVPRKITARLVLPWVRMAAAVALGVFGLLLIVALVRGRGWLFTLAVLGLLGSGAVFAVPAWVTRNDWIADYWCGAADIAAARVKMTVSPARIEVTATGYQGRPWMTADVARPSEAAHLLIGQADSTSESVVTRISHLVVQSK